DNVILPELSAVAPIPILAGDIRRPDMPSLKAFLLAQCERFKHSFYVAGNHCFYGGEYETRLQQRQAFAILILVFIFYITRAALFSIMCAYSVQHFGLMFLGKVLQELIDLSMIIMPIQS
ncbi:unnamed protein product, partial [Rotaria socialis]